MEDAAVTRITQLLAAAEGGDSSARERLWEEVYDELRRLARERLAGESPLHRRDATTLAHEAYERLRGPGGNAHWSSRAHFFAAAAEALRRICVDDARKRKRIKRGGGRARVSLDAAAGAIEDDGLDEVEIDDALKLLEQHDARKARVVVMRFWGNLDRETIAAALNVSVRTVDNDWDYARAWLYRAMGGEQKQEPLP